MKRNLFIIFLWCFAATTAFPQITIDFQLNEDKLQDTCYFEIDYGQQATFSVTTSGEPDRKGQIPVQLALENGSYDYYFYLFDHVWDKKQLKKEYIHIEKGYPGENTLKVENIKLSGKCEIDMFGKYNFPDILVEEGKTYKCMIPIHLVKPKPGLFCRKRKMLERHIDCTIAISVEVKDHIYERLESSCDSLSRALDTALTLNEFCTHPQHKPSFDEQSKRFTDANSELRSQIERHLDKKGWSKDSKKRQSYEALLDSLDEMDNALKNYKYVCTKHDEKKHSCGYCKLSLEQIYNRLNRLYIDLHNGTIQKKDIMKEVNSLYKCCTDSTCAKHAQAWKKGDRYKTAIIEFYNNIKNY